MIPRRRSCKKILLGIHRPPSYSTSGDAVGSSGHPTGGGQGAVSCEANADAFQYGLRARSKNFQRLVMKNDFGIKGFIPMSLLDWPGKVCSIIFLGGCNFRCPACHNHDLVLRPGTLPDHPLESILNHLLSRGLWIDGVTITGGEPTLKVNLPELLKTIKAVGMRAKLDTNGSNPEMLERLITDSLVDAVYMDVKAPLTAEDYSRVSGVPVNVARIERSIQILRSSGIEAAFRTTVVPGLVEEPQIAQIRDQMGSVDRYIIQSFRNKDTLDPGFASIEEFRPERMERLRELVEVPSLSLRVTRNTALGNLIGITSHERGIMAAEVQPTMGL